MPLGEGPFVLGPGPSLLSFSTRGSQGPGAPCLYQLYLASPSAAASAAQPTLPALAFSSSLSPTPYKPRRRPGRE